MRRVAERVKLGGHHVPDETVRRRFHAGLKNFFTLYRPLMDAWWVYDSSQAGHPRRIASGREDEGQASLKVEEPTLWKAMEARYGR